MKVLLRRTALISRLNFLPIGRAREQNAIFTGRCVQPPSPISVLVNLIPANAFGTRELKRGETVRKNQEEELEFQNLPLFSRQKIVTNLFIGAIQRCGYKALVENNSVHPWGGAVVVRKTLHLAVLSVDNKFTANEILGNLRNLIHMARTRFERPDNDYDVRIWQHRWRGHKVPTVKETSNVSLIEAKLILCSLEKIPRSRIENALPSYTAANEGRLFKGSTVIGTATQTTIFASIDVLIFDGIKSEASAVSMSAQLHNSIPLAAKPERNRT
jgi:hypothetical protein